MYNSTGSHSYTESMLSSRSSSYCVDEVSQNPGLHPPNAKALYMHRKKYAESVINQLTKSQYRVEHLFTCTLDGVQVSSLQDCVERLQLLEARGQVWAQGMVLELDDQNMLLKDMESKEVLDCLSISRVSEISSVINGDFYDSLLMISVKERQQTNVFMFQCDSVRADYVKRDLERCLQSNNNANKIRGQPSPNVKERKRSPPPSEQEESISDYDGPVLTSTSRQEPFFIEDTPSPPIKEMVSRSVPYTETERNVDILNHLINDIEEFVEVVAAVPIKDKKKKKKKKQKAVQGLPSAEEFAVCLQKIKMSFNLLAVLKDQIKDPSAAELTHCLFNILELVVSRCPEGLSATIIAPLLEPECVRFLSEETTEQEDELWQSLGDAWNIPSTQWPEDDEDIPIFTPVFNDGWQPPEISTSPSKPINRHNSQQSNRSQNSRSWQIPQSLDTSEKLPVSCMRVLQNFRGRNERELSVTKGEVLELLDISKRWWKVRNKQGKEGFVPNNVLKSTEIDDTQEEMEFNPALHRKSRPEEVKAWLEHQGFSKITVRCLGGLSGAMLLGMKQDELKIVCPEEGRRVYYQLQNVKSALALASDVRPLE